ncbi:hypothetical protein HBH61_247000 [Parastagonospora nodorum]|nr:hypothetical protein HBH61_247000 [Parastagonospora nodorum]
MLQTNVREGYRIMTLEVVKLIEDLISYYSAKVKTENLSNTLTPTLSKTAQRQSSSVVSNRSTASITNKFSVASLTKPAILNNANIALVDAVHHSVIKQFPMFRLITKESQQKLEENYFKIRAQHLKYDVIDALTITLIKNDDDLLGTVNSHIKLRRLGAPLLLEQPSPPKKRGRHSKLIPDRPLLKRRKTEAADSRHAKVSRGRTKKDKDLEDSDTSSDVLRLRRRDRAAARARLAKRKHPLDSDDYCLDSSSDINSKDDLEDEEATTAKDLAREQKERLKALLNAKTRDSLSARVRTAIEHCTLEEQNASDKVQNAQAEGNATEHNAVNDDDKLYPTKGERTFHCADPLALQFCFFTLAAANKLIIPEANTPTMHSKATKHCPALSAAQFVIVCSFRKIDKHVFRAYNTISVTAQRTIIRKGSPYRNIIANVKHDASEHESSHKYKELISQGAAVAQSIKGDFLPYFQSCLCLDFLSTVQNAKQQCRDILEKEGLNKSEASRRVIFNCFKMQAIASYPALATLKAAQFKTYSSCKVKRFTLNSVKDLFTNLSKDYFLVREARAITKSSLKFQNLSNLCSKVKILGTLSRT